MGSHVLMKWVICLAVMGLSAISLFHGFNGLVTTRSVIREVNIYDHNGVNIYDYNGVKNGLCNAGPSASKTNNTSWLENGFSKPSIGRSDAISNTKHGMVLSSGAFVVLPLDLMYNARG